MDFGGQIRPQFFVHWGMPRSARRFLWLAVAAVLVAIFGCSAEGGDSKRPPDDPTPGVRPADRVVATILMAGDKLTVVGLRPVHDSELPKAQAVLPMLAWKFETETAQVVATGKITVPLVTLAEFDETGKPAPQTTVAGAAMFEIEIPNVGGTLTLSDPTAAGGTSQKAWGGLGDALEVFIEKLNGPFEFEGGGGSSGSGPSGGAGGSAGAGAGGSNSGGTSTGTGGASGVEAGPLVQMVKPSTECVGMTLLVVAEGYTAQEETKFQADAEQIIGTISGHSGYKEHWKDVAVYRKFFASKDSGISDPAANIQLDTPFRVQHDAVVHRSITSGSGISPAVAAELAAAKAEVKADAVMYIANTSEWAGAAMPWNREGFSSAHPDAGLIMSHEIAHALFDLADEYDEGTCNPESSFQGPNVALDLKSIPWAPLLSKGVELPTTAGGPDTVGAFEGAMYCTSGVYRPQHDCKMRHAEVGFCKVCLEQINNRFEVRTAACNQGACDHSECKAGGALTKGCSACTASVCAEKPECCDPKAGWSDECVALAKKTAGPCRGVCYDGKASCAHDEGAEGGPLSASCSSCAGSVCEKDAFCCDNKWDAICVTEAERDPYCKCKPAG